MGATGRHARNGHVDVGSAQFLDAVVSASLASDNANGKENGKWERS